MEETQIILTVANNEQEKQPKKNGSPFMKNLQFACTLLIVAGILLSVWFICRPNNKTENYNLFIVDMISELTSLECRFHNVSILDQEGNALSVGKKYVWFEYDVIIKAGIDMNEVIIEEPTKEGVIRIYLPPARILSADKDEASIQKPVKELGWLTELTTESERQIINEGVRKLKEDPQTEEIVRLAYNSAKDVIKQYIINMGKLMGEDYTVEWIQKPANVQTTTTEPTN